MHAAVIAIDQRTVYNLYTMRAKGVHLDKATGRMRLDEPENAVQPAVLEYLQTHPDVAWCQRINVGGAFMPSGKWVEFAFTGCSDIIGQMIDGKFLAVECKGTKGRTRKNKKTGIDDQKEFLERVANNKGVSLLVRSVDDCQKGLRFLGY